MAKMPFSLVSNFSVSTGIRFSFELEAPVGDRAELHGQPEERQHDLGRLLDARRPGPLTVTALEACRLAVQRRSPGRCMKLILPLADERPHLLAPSAGAPRNSSRRCSSVSASRPAAG